MEWNFNIIKMSVVPKLISRIDAIPADFGGLGVALYGCWGFIMAQSLWKSVWQFLIKWIILRKTHPMAQELYLEKNLAALKRVYSQEILNRITFPSEWHRMADWSNSISVSLSLQWVHYHSLFLTRWLNTIIWSITVLQGTYIQNGTQQFWRISNLLSK